MKYYGQPGGGAASGRCRRLRHPQIHITKTNEHNMCSQNTTRRKARSEEGIGFGKEPEAAERRPGSGRSTPAGLLVNAPHATPRRC